MRVELSAFKRCLSIASKSTTGGTRNNSPESFLFTCTESLLVIERIDESTEVKVALPITNGASWSMFVSPESLALALRSLRGQGAVEVAVSAENLLELRSGASIVEIRGSTHRMGSARTKNIETIGTMLLTAEVLSEVHGLSKFVSKDNKIFQEVIAAPHEGGSPLMICGTDGSHVGFVAYRPDPEDAPFKRRAFLSASLVGLAQQLGVIDATLTAHADRTDLDFRDESFGITASVSRVLVKHKADEIPDVLHMLAAYKGDHVEGGTGIKGKVDKKELKAAVQAAVDFADDATIFISVKDKQMKIVSVSERGRSEQVIDCEGPDWRVKVRAFQFLKILEMSQEDGTVIFSVVPGSPDVVRPIFASQGPLTLLVMPIAVRGKFHC